VENGVGITLAKNGATVPQTMAALGDKTPKVALYYCRLANQPVLNDRAAEIIDAAFEKGPRSRRLTEQTENGSFHYRSYPLSFLIV
jgi:hypothetical protein